MKNERSKEKKNVDGNTSTSAQERNLLKQYSLLFPYAFSPLCWNNERRIAHTQADTKRAAFKTRARLPRRVPRRLQETKKQQQQTQENRNVKRTASKPKQQLNASESCKITNN